MHKVVFYTLLLLVVLAPLPFGSNIPIAWNFCATLIAMLTIVWAATSIKSPRKVSLSLSPWIMVLFLLPCVWVLIQVSCMVPDSLVHPLWQLAGESLSVHLPETVSIAPDTTVTALMRLLTYGLVFFLSFQLCRNRANARIAIIWIAVAGILYALYGLIIYWGGYGTVLLHENKGSMSAVTSTFINRNSYATYVGFTLICAMGLFLDTMLRPQRGMEGYLLGKQKRIELFVTKSWRPLLGLMLMVVALLSTHSRGGFISTAIAITLLLIVFASKNRLNTKTFLLAITGVLAVTFVAYAMSSEVLLKRLDTMSLESEARLAVYENTIDAIEDNPWLGFGYGTFKQAYRLYHYDEIPGIYHKAHNTYLENIFTLGLPAAGSLFLSILVIAITLLKGIIRRRRDWIYPAIGFAVTLQVAIHSLVDFSLQIPAVAITYAAITGVATAQSFSSIRK